VILAKISSSASAALAWWIVPIVGVTGAIIYVIWLAKFKEKFDNTTHRSVANFSIFQSVFRNEKKKKDK
jgi:type II secretory pathway component PulF